MESVPQIGRIWVSTFSRIWQKRANPPNFLDRSFSITPILHNFQKFPLLIMRKWVDDTIQLNATDLVKLETAVAQVRNVMSNLHTRQAIIE